MIAAACSAPLRVLSLAFVRASPVATRACRAASDVLTFFFFFFFFFFWQTCLF